MCSTGSAHNSCIARAILVFPALPVPFSSTILPATPSPFAHHASAQQPRMHQTPHSPSPRGRGGGTAVPGVRSPHQPLAQIPIEEPPCRVEPLAYRVECRPLRVQSTQLAGTMRMALPPVRSAVMVAENRLGIGEERPV